MNRLRDSLPEPVKDVLRPFYYRYRDLVYKISLPYYRFLDRFRLNDLEEVYTEEYFQKRTSHPWRTATEVVVDELAARYDPNDVVDVGAAIGVYLDEFHRYDVETLGIEGAAKAVENAVANDVIQADLRDPVHISREADLVICFEVAEHLHPQYADRLVRTIYNATEDGGVAIVSAAPPGQHGTHHLNLQEKDYWIGKFKAIGFDYELEDTEKIQESLQEGLEEQGVNWPALNNIMVFRKQN